MFAAPILIHLNSIIIFIQHQSVKFENLNFEVFQNHISYSINNNDNVSNSFPKTAQKLNPQGNSLPQVAALRPDRSIPRQHDAEEV
jgi:hypothetical protein